MIAALLAVLSAIALIVGDTHHWPFLVAVGNGLGMLAVTLIVLMWLQDNV